MLRGSSCRRSAIDWLEKESPRGGAEMFLNPNIRIGCSGWQYRDWRDDFYPSELPQSLWLDYYAQYFDTIEGDSTLYRLPDAGHGRGEIGRASCRERV